MINAITVVNQAGESLRINLRNPAETGFLISSIDGLGPVKGSLNIAEVVTSDGGQFNSARKSTRNIVIHLYFYEDNVDGLSIEELRRKSYRYFKVKRRVSLLIETDTRNYLTYGYVESNDPDIFSSRESSQISIICPDPYLYGTSAVSADMSSLTSTFEFPFSNESLTQRLLVLGELSSEPAFVIIYEGDSDNGVTIDIRAQQTLTGTLTLFNEIIDGSMAIDLDKISTLTGAAVGIGDVIEINTVIGNKYAKLIRSGVETNILNCIDRDASWFQLVSGDNIISYSFSDSNLDPSSVRINVMYEELFEGV